jgi:membrane protein DedA with SNARE-associated domain
MLGDLARYALGFFNEYPYFAPFLVLLLCGMGLPLPEEVTLIGAGVFLHRGNIDFWKITAVCSAAILIGDSIPYWLGRRFGMSALRWRVLRRIVHPERFTKLERKFQEHGNWATFACRFFAGVRIPGYFLAGTMRMSYARFLVLDALGVLLSVPISIWFGKVFGENVDELKRSVHDLHLILAFLVLALVVVMVVRGRRRTERSAAAPGVGSAEGGGKDGPG